MYYDFESMMDSLSSTPLSSVIERLLPIALSFGDYEGFCTLYQLTVPFDEGTKSTVSDMKQILQESNASNIDECIQKGLMRAVDIRTLEKDKTISFSVLQIEEHIDNLMKMIQINDVPNGLAPVDQYFYSERMNTQNSKLLLSKIDNDKALARIRSYVSTRITLYSQKQDKQRKETIMESSKNIFIIHGHDEINLLRLQKMIRDDFHLTPIVLKDQPNGGTTIIEKFEKYAPSCCYAFALFTPDDIVKKDDYEYIQARPNVIFELGWFYARLGRGRVAILEKKNDNSEILSDLQGIMRIQFKEDVNEIYREIQKELQTFGII